MSKQLTMDETKLKLLEFAEAHKITLETRGEVGFGRPCVGFTDGNCYIDYCPTQGPDYDRIKDLEDTRLYAPDGVESYHKHDCLAVLVPEKVDEDYDRALCQLLKWVEKIQSLGEVEIVEFNRFKEGYQPHMAEIIMGGMTGKAIKLRHNGQD